MRMDVETRENLVRVFFNHYTDDWSKAAVMPVMRVFDFDYDYNRGELVYEGCSPSVTYGRDEWEVIWGRDKSCRTSSGNHTITPLDLSRFDLETIEKILDNHKEDAPKASPVFDALGWILRLDSENYRLHFIGGPHYDVWKEEDIPWNYDLEPGATDWRTGDGWRDGWNLEKDIPKNWLEI